MDGQREKQQPPCRIWKHDQEGGPLQHDQTRNHVQSLHAFLSDQSTSSSPRIARTRSLPKTTSHVDMFLRSALARSRNGGRCFGSRSPAVPVWGKNPSVEHVDDLVLAKQRSHAVGSCCQENLGATQWKHISCMAFPASGRAAFQLVT